MVAHVSAALRRPSKGLCEFRLSVASNVRLSQKMEGVRVNENGSVFPVEKLF